MLIRANSIGQVGETRSHREVSAQHCTNTPATSSCQQQADNKKLQNKLRRERCAFCKGLVNAAPHVPSGQQVDVCLQLQTRREYMRQLCKGKEAGISPQARHKCLNARHGMLQHSPRPLGNPCRPPGRSGECYRRELLYVRAHGFPAAGISG